MARFSATVIALYVCALLVRPFLPAVTWALALAVVTHRLYDWLSTRIDSENLTAGVAVFLVTVLIVAPAVWVTDQIVDQATQVIKEVQAGTVQEKWNRVLESTPWLARITGWLTEHVDFQGEMERASSSIASSAGGFVRRSFDVAIQVVILPFVLFFFFRDRSRFMRALRSLAAIVRQQRFDLLHAHYWMSGWVGRQARRRLGLPLVQSFHTLARAKNASLAPGAH